MGRFDEPDRLSEVAKDMRRFPNGRGMGASMSS